jgi:hypothetical protein
LLIVSRVEATLRNSTAGPPPARKDLFFCSPEDRRVRRAAKNHSRRNPMKKMICTITVVMSIVVTAAQEQSAPQVQHRLIPASKASNPAPPTDALTSQKNSIGEGPLTVSTAQPASFWQERQAVGGSFHAIVRTDFLYDSNHGIIYGYRVGDFECKNGQAENGGVLEALYTSGNKEGKPAGSGWYAAQLHAGKCGATESGVYGCKFDSSGTPTECGRATVNSQTGEIDLAAQ